jgi:uncharacterized protein
MKFHLQQPAANVVTGTGPGWVRVGQTEYRGNIVLLPDAVVQDWAPNGFDALGESDYASLLSYRPEMVLLGTGSAQRFPHPRLLQSLAAARGRRRGHGHARRVPHVQHPRRGGSARGGGADRLLIPMRDAFRIVVVAIVASLALVAFAAEEKGPAERYTPATLTVFNRPIFTFRHALLGVPPAGTGRGRARAHLLAAGARWPGRRHRRRLPARQDREARRPGRVHRRARGRA